MKNITQNNKLSVFNYSILNNDEKLATLENEKKLNEIYNKYQPEVGAVCFNNGMNLLDLIGGMFTDISININSSQIVRI